MFTFLLWQAPPAAVQAEGLYSSIVVIIATVAIAVSKGYLNKQFSGVHERIGKVEKEVSGLRVEMAAMDGRIKRIPADTALQIAESYDKGRTASRAAFVSKDACATRQKDVDRRLEDIESSARSAEQTAERSGYRIDNLEKPRHGGND